MTKTKKERNATGNAWKRDKRDRLLLLTTIEEGQSIRAQAQKEELTITRYLVQCHNEHLERQNKSENAQTTNKGIIYHKTDY